RRTSAPGSCGCFRALLPAPPEPRVRGRRCHARSPACGRRYHEAPRRDQDRSHAGQRIRPCAAGGRCLRRRQGSSARAEHRTRPRPNARGGGEPGRLAWPPCIRRPTRTALHMTAQPAVQVRSLGKQFRLQRSWKDLVLRPRHRDIRVALADVDLEVARGEFFGVLGENGAGKTTLFKILATLVRPDSGSALVGGFDVSEEPEQVRRLLVPVIPAERSLYWRLSAEESLRLYASLYGLGHEDATRRISEVLEIIGLEDVGRKQVGLFSSGMKQRLLIGRALLGRPAILLLDEPTRSLDPLSARAFRTFLKKQIGAAQQTTVLLATHDHEEVTELCDRVAVLDQGRVLASGTTEALLSSSRSRVCSIWT